MVTELHAILTGERPVYFWPPASLMADRNLSFVPATCTDIVSCTKQLRECTPAQNAWQLRTMRRVLAARRPHAAAECSVGFSTMPMVGECHLFSRQDDDMYEQAWQAVQDAHAVVLVLVRRNHIKHAVSMTASELARKHCGTPDLQGVRGDRTDERKCAEGLLARDPELTLTMLHRKLTYTLEGAAQLQRAAHEAARRPGISGVVTIGYEELMSKPTATLQRVFDMLALPDATAHTARYVIASYNARERPLTKVHTAPLETLVGPVVYARLQNTTSLCLRSHVESVNEASDAHLKACAEHDLPRRL